MNQLKDINIETDDGVHHVCLFKNKSLLLKNVTIHVQTEIKDIKLSYSYNHQMLINISPSLIFYLDVIIRIEESTKSMFYIDIILMAWLIGKTKSGVLLHFFTNTARPTIQN